MRPREALILFILLAFTIISPAQPARPSDTVAIVNVNVVPMDTERLLTNQTVIISGGFITAIGPFGKIKVPSGAVRIEAKGKYLIPGLVDAHAHLYSTTEMPLYVANGVTTVFDLNGRPPHLLWRKKIAAGELFGPTIFACGPKFDFARTPEEAVAEVERQFQAGYDGVKIYVRVSKEELPALTAAARRHNMIIVGHAVRLAGFEATVNAGQSIAHAEEYLYSFFNRAHDPANPFKVEIKLDESRIPEAVALTKKAGVSVIPTLITYDHIIKQVAELDEFLKGPEFKYLAPSQWDILQPERNRYKNGFRPEAIPGLRMNLDFQKKLVKALHDAGVPIIAGTDSLGVGTVSGFSLHDELKIFVSIGFSPYDALRTATSGAAEFLKASDKFGAITVGKRADLLLLAANPLEDITNTKKLDGVMVRGKFLPQPRLRAMLEALPSDYKKESDTISSLFQKDPAAATRYLDENDPFGQLGGAVLENMTAVEGIEKMKATLLRVRQTAPGSSIVGEDNINQFGYRLLQAKKIKEAIGIFQINVEFYPASANVYDSLAEAYMDNGDKELAVKFYKKTLEMNPQNNGAVQNLKKLQQ
jgi:imidazolonepropionase-like amidohydrolase